MDRKGLPPCGGSGLKYTVPRVPDVSKSLPPCGGSGLKLYWLTISEKPPLSPSVWREWIEMSVQRSPVLLQPVSLRVEGVD